MMRREGFIDLNRMIDKGEIKRFKHDLDFLPARISSFINDNGEIFFFKRPMVGEPYSELIAEELLKDFNLPHAEYDLAVYDNYKGVLTKNFRKYNCDYVSVESILNEYDSGLIDPSNAWPNTLENVWNALEYRYRDYANKGAIVSKLMDQIVDLFIFDILIGNCDRTCWNYQIEEGEYNINLAPIFDNETVVYNCKNTSLLVDDDRKSLDLPIPGLYEEIEKFLKYSDSKYVDRFKEKISLISDENIESVFDRISKKTGYDIPNGIADEYMWRFIDHREKLEAIIKKYDEGQVIR